jgi:carbon-monoxide dehydrogenase iron sulfur subunit
MSKEVLVHFDRCIGCLSCQLACAVAHSDAKSLLGAVIGEEKPLKRIFVHQVENKKIPLSCRHCEEAPCIDACIAGAMHRTPEGTVVNEGGEHECVGCWMCVMVCPYGVIRSMPDERKAVKCDRNCFDDFDEPACVRACPTGALQYSTVDLFGKKQRQGFLSRALVTA